MLVFRLVKRRLPKPFSSRCFVFQAKKAGLAGRLARRRSRRRMSLLPVCRRVLHALSHGTSGGRSFEEYQHEQ